MTRAIRRIALCFLLASTARAAAQDGNYIMRVDSIEARLANGTLNIIDFRGSRAQGDRTQRVTVMFPDSMVMVAKLAKAPVNGSAFNNEPRYELGAYEIQRLFLDPDDFVVPPTVLRAEPLAWLRQHDNSAEATFSQAANSVVVILQYWLLQVSPENIHDRNRERSDSVYARHLGNFNIFTYLIRHNDSNVGNFLISGNQEKPRVFSVDNGLAFESEISDRGYVWRNIRVERLPRATIERLRTITPERLREALGVLAQFEIRAGQLIAVEKTANLDANRGVRRSGTSVQFGLRESEIRGVESRLRNLLKDVDEGKIRVF
jgi:hypothetical protein